MRRARRPCCAWRARPAPPAPPRLRHPGQPARRRSGLPRRRVRAWCARGTGMEQAWEGVRAVAGAGSALRRAVCSAPVSGWSLSLFFFLIGQARFRIYSFLCSLILAGRRGGVSGPFGLNFSLHTPRLLFRHTSYCQCSTRAGELGGELSSVLGSLCFSDLPTA